MIQIDPIRCTECEKENLDPGSIILAIDCINLDYPYRDDIFAYTYGCSNGHSWIVKGESK